KVLHEVSKDAGFLADEVTGPTWGTGKGWRNCRLGEEAEHRRVLTVERSSSFLLGHALDSGNRLDARDAGDSDTGVKLRGRLDLCRDTARRALLFVLALDRLCRSGSSLFHITEALQVVINRLDVGLIAVEGLLLL